MNALSGSHLFNRRWPGKVTAIVFLLPLLVFPKALRASDEPQPGADPPLAKASVSYSYTLNLAGNPQGGIVPGQTSYADNHRLTIQLPLGSAGDTFKSSELILEAYQRSGVDLSATAIGNQFTVQQLYGIETLAFYSIRLQGKLPALGGTYKLGRFSSGDDFATWPYYTLAMNNAIDGNPQSLPVNTGFSSFPNAVWGATVDLAVGDRSQLRLGSFQVTNPDVLRYHGFNWAIKPGDGLLLMSQLEHCDSCPGVGWLSQRRQGPPAAAAAVVAQEPSYPLHRRRLALGGYWSLYSQPSFSGADPPASTYGAWLHGDATLWQPRLGGPALAAWASMTSSPQPAVARLPLFWALGLVHYGLIPSRPQDSAMLALYQGRFSPSYMTSIGARNGSGASETVLELGYRHHLGTQVFLQPNLQLVVHPSGFSTIPTALVLGLQAGLRL